MKYELTGTLTKKLILRLFLLDDGSDTVRVNGWNAEIRLSEKHSLDPKVLMKVIKNLAVDYTDKSNKKADQHLNILRFDTFRHGFCNEAIVGFQVFEKSVLTDNRSTLGLGFGDMDSERYTAKTAPVYIYGITKTREQLKELRKKSLGIKKFKEKQHTIGEWKALEQKCEKEGYSWRTADAVQTLLKENPKSARTKKLLQISKGGFIALRDDAYFMPYKKKMIVL